MASMGFSETVARTDSRSLLDRAFIGLAVLFQLASAQTTFSGAQEFLTRSPFLAATITLVIQAGVVLSGERAVAIVSGTQRRRTSILPVLLLTSITFASSILFSGFGFYKHYAYSEGNKASEFASTSTETGEIANELERYRTNVLGFAASSKERVEGERRRQDARATNPWLTARSRSAARIARDRLAGRVQALTNLQSKLAEINVIASVTQPSPELMRQTIVTARNQISAAVAELAPDYLNANPIPGEIPKAVPPAEMQSAFVRDVRLRRPPALLSVGAALMVDLASLLSLLCNVYVSPTEERILRVKRKVRKTWCAWWPLRETHDTFSVVQMTVRGFEARSPFKVVFEKPDWALMGSDLEANRFTIAETLAESFGGAILEGFYSGDNHRIQLDQPLFDQLGPDRMVYLHVRPGRSSNA